MPDLVQFDYAIIRVVPRVERGECLNVGIILYCRAHHYLNCAIELERYRLLALCPEIDIEAVEKHLSVIPLICAGNNEGGRFRHCRNKNAFIGS